MYTSKLDAESTRPLDILGISEQEEQLYISLLGHPGATAADLAELQSVAAPKVQRLLGALERKGLATHLPERPRRYLPISPGIAIAALISRRAAQLEQARTCIPALQELAETGRKPDRREEMIELIRDPRAGHRILEEMNHMAIGEVICLKRPPTMITPLKDPAEVETRACERGVRYRSIVDRAFLEQPGAMEHLRDGLRFNEEVRLVSSLPMKLFAIDRLMAFVPLDLERPDTSPHLLVRRSALLDGLWTLFENLWQAAAPLLVAERGDIEEGDVPVEGQIGDDGTLLSLLAAGLNDKTIAGELGISPRTLNRRIAVLLESLDARTRFEAGWLARKHWPEG